ncbi:hypothetical protein GCM10010222_75100 [Streptomyces tanashiensis]|nr:hypothetical protein GCM10010222_75100 [Streptomyces tanashiensis]
MGVVRTLRLGSMPAVEPVARPWGSRTRQMRRRGVVDLIARRDAAALEHVEQAHPCPASRLMQGSLRHTDDGGHNFSHPLHPPPARHLGAPSETGRCERAMRSCHTGSAWYTGS